MIQMNKILFVGAHTDDLEISCGGTIAKLVEQGKHITAISLSHIYGALELEGEFKRSMDVLKPKVSFLCDFETRQYTRDRQLILDFLVGIQDEFDTVFFHSPEDVHQDHSTVGFECMRAFKNHNLIAYGSPFNSLHLSENLFVELSPEHLLKKIDAIRCYKSQSHRVYMQNTVIESQAITRGLQCGFKYAEAFKIIKLRG